MNASEKLLFVTGKLARSRLQRVLEALPKRTFHYEIRVLGVSVAALMTVDMLRRRLGSVQGIDRVIVPGLCGGDLEVLSRELGVPVLRGPKDLKDLPDFLGQDAQVPELDRHDLQIFAEIVDAPLLVVEDILKQARRYRDDGADVIDLGFLPGQPFGHLEESIAALRAEDFRVSVDAADPDLLLRGARAGAEYLLSLNEDTLWVSGESDAVPVVLPRRAGDLRSLYRALEAMAKHGRRCIADPVLDPVHFGFTESLVRYHRLRRRFPEGEIMMGTGNLTELTEADTSGMNALLLGIASELRITHVLTTEVSPHARSVVRELDLARRIHYAAHAAQSLPKGLHGGLCALHECRPFPYDRAEIEALAKDIRDPNYRIQVSSEGIHVYNRDELCLGTDPYTLFPLLQRIQEDPPHAFYMGMELERARIAWQLGKRYEQDEELGWGTAVPERARGRQEVAPSGLKKARSTLQAARRRREGRQKS